MSLSCCSLPIPKPFPIGSSHERRWNKNVFQGHLWQGSWSPRLGIIFVHNYTQEISRCKPQTTCLFLFFPFPCSQIFFAHLGCFKLATLPNEKLINFPKMKLPLKAFSGQCTQSESKDNEYKAVMPSVARREGTSIFTRTFFTYSFMHAFVGSCMHSSMHLFMRAFIHLTSSLLCVGFCLRRRSTKMKIFSVIEEFSVYQKRLMHSLALLLL